MERTPRWFWQLQVRGLQLSVVVQERLEVEEHARGIVEHRGRLEAALADATGSAQRVLGSLQAHTHALARSEEATRDLRREWYAVPLAT